jgi:hypothetical protein
MTAEEVYRKYVRSLPATDRLVLVALIAQDLSSEQTEEESPRRSLSNLRGLGAEIWKDVDAQDYVNDLRDDWHNYP